MQGGLFMASSLVQFRTEDTSRIKAASICEQLGIDLPTYLRACIPFSMKLEPKPESKGLQAMKEASRIAAENGIADLSLDEINAEIAAARNH